MAKQVQVQLVDDIDQSPASETVEFAIDGKSYEIDLNAEHAEGLRGTLAPYVAAARRAGSGRRPGTPAGKAPKSGTAGETQVIRDWAKSQGLRVSDRGRISAEVMAAYQARDTSGVPAAQFVEAVPA